MRDAEKTIGNLADKANLTIIGYIDAEGFPASRAMLAPREREGIRTFWFSTNTSSNNSSEESACPARWRCWKPPKRRNGFGEPETKCTTTRA